MVFVFYVLIKSGGKEHDRERQILYDITYMWNLKKMIQMNLFTKTETDSQT